MLICTAEYIASCLINLSYDKQHPVSNLKLQKLIYYAQAWYLAFNKTPLFSDEIEAWVHGPVVPSVFRRYRDYKWAPISRTSLSAPVPAVVGAHLEEIWRVYGQLNAFDLERLSHAEPPWKEARAGLPADVSSHAVITKDSMQRYYLSRLHG